MGGSFRVVIIDDDADLRRLLQVTLEFTARWTVAVAPDGTAGLALVRQLAPDAVVVDLMMPGMDGYEVCRQLKADPATAGIPVVFLTARQRIDEERVRALGAAGVLFKPFEPDELAARITELCQAPR